MSLTGEIDTSLEYVRVGTRDDGCDYVQIGRTWRYSRVISTSPTIIRVRSERRLRYAPSEIRSLRLRKRDYPGDVETTARCPDGSTSRVTRRCEPLQAITTETLPRLPFRRTSGGRIAWTGPARRQIALCGLEPATVDEGWLDLATGVVDERALLTSRRTIVRVRGGGRVNDFVIPTPGGTQIRRTIWISWTLTFRRLR